MIAITDFLLLYINIENKKMKKEKLRKNLQKNKYLYISKKKSKKKINIENMKKILIKTNVCNP